MAKVTKNQRVLRTVRFMMGLRSPEVHQHLLAYGLSEDVLQEGAALLKSATLPTLSAFDKKPDPRLLEQLNTLENRWFPITKVVLARHFPEVGEWVFRNLAQTQGPDLIVSLTALMTRIAELGSKTSSFGEQGKRALELLAQRGLDGEVIAEINGLLARATEFEPATSPAPDPEAEEQAVDALWAWYLEWSAIARAVIKDRRSLRKLGFLRSRSASASNGDDAAELEDNDDSDDSTPQDETFTRAAPSKDSGVAPSAN